MIYFPSVNTREVSRLLEVTVLDLFRFGKLFELHEKPI
jgi:hypothetical protein